jgi:hypothetical protein
MSAVDADLDPAEREALLAEVRAYLPAYLSSVAHARHETLTDVQALLQLDQADVRRLIAVHSCLSSEVRGFVTTVEDGLRHAPAVSSRAATLTQAVRGSIDWGETSRRRALNGNDRGTFATRTAQRDFDTPANRVIAWLLATIARSLRLSLDTWSTKGPGKADTVRGDLLDLNTVVVGARKLTWLESIDLSRPSARDLGALRASRHRFHRERVVPAAEMMLSARNPGPELITTILCEMLFEPDRAWELYELVIALRLTRAFDAPDRGLVPRPKHLLRGSTRSGAFATYRRPDGGTIELTYQGWPDDAAQSQRAQTAQAHGLKATSSRPDALVIRRDHERRIVDVVVLELKASRRTGYLASGLSQLLGYLGEHPSLLLHPPAAWLVAPDAGFTAAPPDAGSPLWIVGADQVAEHLVARMTA